MLRLVFAKNIIKAVQLYSRQYRINSLKQRFSNCGLWPIGVHKMVAGVCRKGSGLHAIFYCYTKYTFSLLDFINKLPFSSY